MSPLITSSSSSSSSSSSLQLMLAWIKVVVILLSSPPFHIYYRHQHGSIMMALAAPCDTRNTDRVPDEQRLLCDILRHYNPLTRPVRNVSTIIKIGLGLAVNQIFELDEKNQMLITNVWIDHTDEFLKWDPANFGGIYTIRIPAGRIWTPDIVLYNNAADYATKPVDIRAMISHDGNVFLGVPVKLYSSCTIDVTYFPFDTQKCRLKFGSWTYDGWKVDLHGRVSDVDLTRFVLNGEWDVLSAYQVRHVVKYTCCEEPYIDLTFFINMRRKTLYYLFNVFFPTFIMSSLTLLTFLLPPDSGEKCALGITVLLSFSVFMLSVTEKLPETSEFIPLISIYLTAVMSMSAISVCLTVLVLSLHYRPSLGVRRRPPKICRLLIFFCNKDDLKSSQEISPADEAIRRVESNLLQYRKAMLFRESPRGDLVVHMNRGFQAGDDSAADLSTYLLSPLLNKERKHAYYSSTADAAAADVSQPFISNNNNKKKKKNSNSRGGVMATSGVAGNSGNIDAPIGGCYITTNKYHHHHHQNMDIMDMNNNNDVDETNTNLLADNYDVANDDNDDYDDDDDIITSAINNAKRRYCYRSVSNSKDYFYQQQQQQQLPLSMQQSSSSSLKYQSIMPRSVMTSSTVGEYYGNLPPPPPSSPPPPPPHPSAPPPVINYDPSSAAARIHQLYEEIADAIDRLTSQYALEADSARSLREWQSLARAVDRILFWAFVIVTITSTAALLVVTPAVHNAVLEVQRQQEAATQRQESLQAMHAGTGPELEAAIAASLQQQQQHQQQTQYQQTTAQIRAMVPPSPSQSSSLSSPTVVANSNNNNNNNNNNIFVDLGANNAFKTITTATNNNVNNNNNSKKKLKHKKL